MLRVSQCACGPVTQRQMLRPDVLQTSCCQKTLFSCFGPHLHRCLWLAPPSLVCHDRVCESRALCLSPLQYLPRAVPTSWPACHKLGPAEIAGCKNHHGMKGNSRGTLQKQGCCGCICLMTLLAEGPAVVGGCAAARLLAKHVRGHSYHSPELGNAPTSNK